MNGQTQNILIYTLLGGSALAITYMILKKKKVVKKSTSSKNTDVKENLPSAKRPNTLMPKIIKNDLPNPLDKTKVMLVDIPMRKFELVGDKRKKFLDEWIAEDDGVVSIKEMYKRRPSAFSKEDIEYLKSREIYLA